MPRALDLNSLTLLVVIVDAGNLSQAARKLKTSRANVSYHLNQLERSVGVKLLRRTTRSMELTEVGRRLYQHGRSIQNELLAAKEAVATLGHTLRGRVRVGVPSGYGQLVMADWLIGFKRTVSRHRARRAVREPGSRPAARRARHLDPGDGRATVGAGGARAWCRALRGVRRARVCRVRGLPSVPEDLGSVPLITSDVAGQQLRVAATLRDDRREVLLEPTLISENFSFLREAIVAGLGVGLVPDYVVKDEVLRGTVLTALDDWRLSIFGTRLFMLYMPNRQHTRAASTFIDYVARACACRTASR